MGLLERVAERRRPGRTEQRYALDTWLTDYLIPAMGQFAYGGATYPYGVQQTYTGTKIQEIAASLPGYTAALRRCPPAFAAQMVRALVLSQTRFVFRNLPSTSTPRRIFGTRELAPIEKPWTNATTGELVTRMEWHAGCAGNAYVYRQPSRLRVLRPDWVGILYGSQLEPDDPAHALDGDLLAYVYQQGGIYAANSRRVYTLLPDEVAHWSPLPDPECAGIGMSWITPAIREIQGDMAATDHKLAFFRHGATPNMVVKGIPAASQEQFDAIVEQLEGSHAGVRNAYRTLYLTAGADVTVVGADLKQLDFKAVQGAGETRIAMLSRVHPVILAIAEGLAGSALNAGNFGMARRIWADAWIYPTLQDLARALSSLVKVPSDAELWYDPADMPILREDAKDAAEIEQIKASTIVALVNGGFTAESVKAAVMGQNMALLQHSGLLSVQLQPPGASITPNGKPALPAAAGGA